jgi:hypothetical protein
MWIWQMNKKIKFIQNNTTSLIRFSNVCEIASNDAISVKRLNIMELESQLIFFEKYNESGSISFLVDDNTKGTYEDFVSTLEDMKLINNDPNLLSDDMQQDKDNLILPIRIDIPYTLKDETKQADPDNCIIDLELFHAHMKELNKIFAVYKMDCTVAKSSDIAQVNKEYEDFALKILSVDDLSDIDMYQTHQKLVQSKIEEATKELNDVIEEDQKTLQNLSDENKSLKRLIQAPSLTHEEVLDDDLRLYARVKGIDLGKKTSRESILKVINESANS